MEASQAYEELAEGRLTPMWLAAAEPLGSYQGQCHASIITLPPPASKACPYAGRERMRIQANMDQNLLSNAA